VLLTQPLQEASPANISAVLLTKTLHLDYHSVIDSVLLNYFFISAGASTILVFFLLILFIVSFLISGSEVAFFSLSSKDIQILKKRKNPSFKRIVRLLEQPKTLLASMHITQILVNVGIILISASLIDTLSLIQLEYGFLMNLLIKLFSISIFLILFATMLPKVWATHHKVWFAAVSSLLVEICNSLFYRLSRRLVNYSDKIERRFSSVGQAGSEENQIDFAIDLLPEEEASVEEKQILKGIRKFGDTMVKQVMRTRLDVSGIEANLTFHEILKLSEDLHYSRLPVYRSNLDQITGVLHIKDLLPHLQAEPDFNWHPLVRPPFFVHEQKLIEDLLQDFRTKRTHFAIVVDEFGGTSGIITLEDILEEIIGDIKDEFDDEESSIRKIDDLTFIFEGKTMINDVCKYLHLSPTAFDPIRGDADSLAGLLLELAGEFPSIQSEWKWEGFTFIPLAINKNRIDQIKIILPQPQSES
jgi:putative hemolysin